MFPDPFVPGARGREADREDASSRLQVSAEGDKSLRGLNEPFLDVRRQSLLPARPGRSQKWLTTFVPVDH